jgi:hypothetical protein
VPEYRRVPTPGTDPRFIAGLARLVRAAAESASASDEAAVQASS